MTRKILRKSRAKSTYVNYFKRGKAFYNNMEACMGKQEYDSAALSGVHAVISLLDALLIYNTGYISASFDHEDAVGLMNELVNTQGSKEYAKHALEVIKMKTAVEYLDSLVTEKQAIMIQKHTARFYEWVQKQLP